MSCVKIRNLLALYVDDALTPVEAKQVEQHLENCADCRMLLSGLRDDQRLLSSLPMVSPPAGFRDELLRRVALGSQRKPTAIRYLLPRLSTLAAAIVITVLASNLYLFPTVWHGQPAADDASPMSILSQAPESAQPAAGEEVPFGISSLTQEAQPQAEPDGLPEAPPSDRSATDRAGNTEMGQPVEGEPGFEATSVDGEGKLMFAGQSSPALVGTGQERARWLWSGAVGLGLFGIGTGWFAYRYRRLV
ncbi:MAG: anti-sigma factor family protein [Bacillota bacterium]|jgi:hypothetical protein